MFSADSRLQIPALITGSDDLKVLDVSVLNITEYLRANGSSKTVTLYASGVIYMNTKLFTRFDLNYCKLGNYKRMDIIKYRGSVPCMTQICPDMQTISRCSKYVKIWVRRRLNK